MIKLNKIETIDIQMSKDTFTSMMFYIQRAGSQTYLTEEDATNARALWKELHEMENKQ